MVRDFFFSSGFLFLGKLIGRWKGAGFLRGHRLAAAIDSALAALGAKYFTATD